MGIDQSARARALGLTATYTPPAGGTGKFLPQRISVFAQGRSTTVYPTTKFQATSEAQVAAIMGYGCPATAIAEMFFPQGGGGLGTIPVDFYPLADDPAGVAAAGTISVSGTATDAGEYRVRVGGFYLSEKFGLPKGAVVVNNAYRLIGKAISAVLRMPVTPTWTYGAVTASAFTGGTGNGTITALSVTGAPKPGDYTLKLNTVVANGGVWTLTDPDGIVVSSNITMTPGAGVATVISVGGLQFTLTDGAADFGTGVQTTITVPATNVTLTVNWKGITGNDVLIELIGPSLGLVFVVTQPTGGLANPSISGALAQVGGVWESFALNALGINDSTALDALQVFGETRWDALVRKYMVSMVGNTLADPTAATAVANARPTDRVNGQFVAPGSPTMPFLVAAAQLMIVVATANNNPPVGYALQPAPRIIPGTDGQQWDYPTRDFALKRGSSTVEVIDSVVRISDVVTFYHPTGELDPAYRYVAAIVRLQNVAYQVNLEFSKPVWATAVIIPDDQATVNAAARKPKSFKAAMGAIVDGLGLDAIISDPSTTKKLMTAVINPSNANRIDMSVPVQLSGNGNIINVDLPFSFFTGTAPIVG